ncbi:MAG: hypothetical protein M3426_07765 [Actinomycetota bacterium]|nr:hypothetical protein [Actinomycetota bacterium]
MPGAIGFDIYGTLVNPLEMNEHLRPIVGENLADRFSELWRKEQIEYTFRRPDALVRGLRRLHPPGSGPHRKRSWRESHE